MLPDVDYPDNVQFHLIFSGPHVRLKNFKDSKGNPFIDCGDSFADRKDASSEEEDDGSEDDEEEDAEEVDLSD